MIDTPSLQSSSLPRKRDVLIYVLLCSVLATSAWVLNFIQTAEKSDVDKALHSTLLSAHTNLNAQYDSYKNAVRIWSGNSEIRSMIEDISNISSSPQNLVTSQAQKSLRTWLSPRFTTAEFRGFFVIGKDNINLASSRNSNVGLKNILIRQDGFLDKVWAGSTLVSLPLKSDIPLLDIHGVIVDALPTMFAASPVRNAKDNIIAILAFRLEPDVVFKSIFGNAHFGTSGQTYAFDKHGLLLSESRFNSQLQNIGLLSGNIHSDLQVVLKNPGVNLTLGEKPSRPRAQQPLTLMVQQAISKGNGSNTDGYLDYRGVKVVGAWTWDDRNGYGIATEVQADEVFASLNKTRQIIIAFTILSLSTLFVVAYTSAKSKQKVSMALAQARASEMRFRALTDNAQDAIITIGPDGLIMQWNHGAETMLGYAPSEVMGHPVDIIIPQRFRSAHMHGLSNLLKTGERKTVTSAIEIAAVRKDGTEFPIELTLSDWLFDDEIHITSILRDISERHKTNLELRKLSRTVEQNPHMMFITNTDGGIEYANAIFYQRTGYCEQEVIGSNPRFLKSGNTPVSLYENLWKTINSGKVWKSEIEDCCKDGSLFWAHLTIAPIRSEDGEITHYFAVHEDITERKEAEHEVHLAKEQAVVANRVKSDIMANMSHELRTPLNAIIGFSSSIKENIFGPLGHEKYEDYINDIHISGHHLLDLINDILDVSAIEAGAFELHEEQFDLNEVIDIARRLIAPRAKSGDITLQINENLNNPVMFGDERRCKQIFLNLLSNAVKFTPKGGTVTLNSKRDAKGALHITIQDTGCGMDTYELQQAMSKFGQVDSGLNRKHEGTGLGLPLTVGLVEMHGGTLKIKSTKGKGTTVTVTVPKDRILSMT